MSSKINFENNSFDKSVYRDLDNINNTINHHHLTLLKYLVNISSDIMKKDNWIIQHKKELQSILADFWEYILVVIKIDSLNISKVEDFDNLKQKTEDIITLSKEENNQSNVENLLKELDKKYLITVLFKKLTSTGIGINSFLDEVHQKINYDGRINKDINPSDFFLIKEENRSILKIVKNDLKTSRIISDLPSKTKKLASEGSSFSKALDHYFTHNKRLTFIKLIDFYQLLEGFTAMDAKEVGLKKAETWPVIVKNLKKLEHLIQGKASIHDIGEAFKRLKDIPVVPNLTKFKTMVNDIAIKLSKSVNFTVLGGDISMDKDSYNLLQDGIVHILRNCLDHGIELPEERTKLGKKGKGNIEIYCNENEDGMLEMIVKDDGKGINPEIISKKAVEKGIYTEEGVKNLKEDEILDIIFSPHFSQKEEVDELSGRGVGMDVVKKNLEKMDGCIKVESKLGHGTKMTLTLNPGPPKF
jgi:chemotaxis protein histidine kinase CheA